MQSIKLGLGKRNSLLAWAQSSWVAREVERLNPGISVELVGIDTRGDNIQDVPLQQVEGKEFFVAELDEALRSGKTDFSVHSMKDLSLERPPELAQVAVPERELPHDVIFFSSQAALRLERGETIRIGTSYPRRLENLPSFLERALPRAANGKPANIKWVEIRGNVNTRLHRLHEPPNSATTLEGVVLAFAGIQRLHNDPAGKIALRALLLHVRWMVMPLKECPTAPAQGSLALECRKEDLETIRALSLLNDPKALATSEQERMLLKQWGGGCHQRFGATAIDHPSLGNLLYVRGKKSDGTAVCETRWQEPGKPRGKQSWNGKQWRMMGQEEPLLPTLPSLVGKMVFLSHWRALHDRLQLGTLPQSRVWTSGTASWYKLAKKGVWVEGCAEGLGFEWMKTVLGRAVLGLGDSKDWHVLTHHSAGRAWKGILPLQNVHATYRLSEGSEPLEAAEELMRADEAYFSSFSQFERLRSSLRKETGVSCGPGRTAEELREAGIDANVFPSEVEWREWCK